MSKLRYIVIALTSITLTSGLVGCASKKKIASTWSDNQPHVYTTRNDDRSQQASLTPEYHSNGLRHDQKLIVDEAMTWMGVPYRYGGEDHAGADCSGLTMMVYKNALGIKLPRTSAEQQKFCSAIGKPDLETGDLVFFCTGRDKSRISHVGIYLGDNAFIHASSTKGVVISRITDPYFTRTYHSSGHVDRKYDNSPRHQAPETQPLQFEFDENELDKAIELRIDSLNQLGMVQKYQP